MPSKRPSNLSSFALNLFTMVTLSVLKGRNLLYYNKRMAGERIKYSYIVCGQRQWNRMKTQINYL